MDLLLHEVVVATLHDVVHLHLQRLEHTWHSQAAVCVTLIENAICTLAQMHHIIVLQHYDSASK